MSRIRQATKLALPTSGHIVSHNPTEIRDTLTTQNLNHVLVLDDTSFSGNTNLIFEQLVCAAFPDRKISFTHAFLILNTGTLGSNPGAKHRLEVNGNQVLGGSRISTPRDDGWHFFDLVKQENFTEHLVLVKELLQLMVNHKFANLASSLLANEQTLRILFPNIFTRDELEEKKKTGHFIGLEKLNGDFHVRNPQLLPNIIEQGHLFPIQQWHGAPEEILNLLLQLGQLFEKGKHEQN